MLLFADGGHDTAGAVAGRRCLRRRVITDRYDGRSPGARGQVTDFGKIADPIADKALTGAALIGLSIAGRLCPGGSRWSILVREVGVTLLRFWVIRHGVIPASRGGKAKTVLQIIAIGLYILPLPGCWPSLRWWVMGGGGGADRDHRHRLRLPGADPAPHQRAGHAGRRGPPGRRRRQAPARRADTAA